MVTEFGETDYMVTSKIMLILYSNLSRYLKTEDIFSYQSNNAFKYVIKINTYKIEILYEFVDNYYRIKLENWHNNAVQRITLLTQSRMFQKDIKKNLKKNKLSVKSFENHMRCFSTLIGKVLDDYNNLKYLECLYATDLKFDGIFL